MMQAGTYYIGDLAYVMHPEWEEFCSITIDGHDCLDGEFNLSDGRRFATYGTAYGDGSYQSSTNDTLYVDAGLIGCIRIEDISEDLTEDQIRDLGMIHNFEKAFHTSGGRGEANWDGVIKFGEVSVETDPYVEEEEDEYDYEDDYDYDGPA
jgi:hypothetical protein